VNPDVDLNNDDDDSEGEVKKARRKAKRRTNILWRWIAMGFRSYRT
jgi:hypothetical protein